MQFIAIANIELDIKPEDKTYENCVEESIKCHHVCITNYLKENLVSDSNEQYNLNNTYNCNIYYYCLRYRKYLYHQPNLKHKFMFFYLCEFDHFNLVNHFLKSKRIDIKSTIIHTIKI